MQLSKRQKVFGQFLKFASNFVHFIKKMTVITYVFPKLQTVKDVVRQMSKNICFRKPFDSQHVKCPQTMSSKKCCHPKSG